MTKKDFVLKMLEKLEKQWKLAKDLRKFILLGVLDNTAVNWIIQLLKEMAVYSKNNETKESMRKIAEKMEILKNIELEEQIGEREKAESLLSTI
jgi:hypothetical protein